MWGAGPKSTERLDSWGIWPQIEQFEGTSIERILFINSESQLAGLRRCLSIHCTNITAQPPLCSATLTVVLRNFGKDWVTYAFNMAAGNGKLGPRKQRCIYTNIELANFGTSRCFVRPVAQWRVVSLKNMISEWDLFTKIKLLSTFGIDDMFFHCFDILVHYILHHLLYWFISPCGFWQQCLNWILWQFEIQIKLRTLSMCIPNFNLLLTTHLLLIYVTMWSV